MTGRPELYVALGATWNYRRRARPITPFDEEVWPDYVLSYAKSWTNLGMLSIYRHEKNKVAGNSETNFADSSLELP